jgi:hypothetical protein
MKKRKRDVVGITSIIMTLAGFIWIGGFRFSAMEHDVRDLKEDVRRINRLNAMDIDFNNMNARLRLVEQRCP